jgi:uncharacterized membrane protein
MMRAVDEAERAFGSGASFGGEGGGFYFFILFFYFILFFFFLVSVLGGLGSERRWTRRREEGSWIMDAMANRVTRGPELFEYCRGPKGRSNLD